MLLQAREGEGAHEVRVRATQGPTDPDGGGLRLQRAHYRSNGVRRHDHAPDPGPRGAIFTTEKGTMIVEPDAIEDNEVEKLLDIKV